MSSDLLQKKHKKHKSDKRERLENVVEKQAGLKLILKVGGQSTPDNVTSSDQLQDSEEFDSNDLYYGLFKSHKKKSKKKKKKKDKLKDRDKKHRHHHKDKKRKREENEVVDNNEEQRAELCSLLGTTQVVEPQPLVTNIVQEKQPLQKMLEQLLSLLEKKDPQHFFAAPVTDKIAPGYSSIIAQPMDFSTIRHKIEKNLYLNLQGFVEDFKLMCTNAMKYNHIDTIYYKTSKKLLQSGLKLVQPEKLGWLFNIIPELTTEHVGYEMASEQRQIKDSIEDLTDADYFAESKNKMPSTKFEAIPDELTSEEILLRAQSAARKARLQLYAKKGSTFMGFLKQRRDGTTNLNILVGGDNCNSPPKKRPVLLGHLIGKPIDSSGVVHGFHEDKRNAAKPVKPLYYGAFGSYAPSYDSAFANLAKDESELVFQTYGSDTAQQYAESVLNFVKESDYATHLVDSLLDLLTGGDHARTKKILEQNKALRDEEEAVKAVLEAKPIDAVKVDVDELRKLQHHGINMNFLDNMDEEIRVAEEKHEMQQRLDQMYQLLERLHHTQDRRLSAPSQPPSDPCQPPSDEEIPAGETFTHHMLDAAKRVAPGDAASIAGIRRALGLPAAAPDLENHEVPDLELELRQFLENESHLGQSPLRDDKTIEEMLME